MRERPVDKIFRKAAQDKAEGNCPFCGKAIHPNQEFRDEISKREYKISGLCQDCQDKFFGKEVE